MCGNRGDQVLYGMLPEPPGSHQRAGGCLINVNNPDYICPTCDTAWQIDPVRVLHRGSSQAPP